MKKTLSVFLLLVAGLATAQIHIGGGGNSGSTVGTITTLTTTGTSGPATYNSGTLNIPQYSATSLSFAGLASGTNTTAAMLVGTGASLGVTGSGTINATSVNGNTYPGSATFVSGGIPYGTSTTAQAYSALLTANAVMVGGGAATAPKTITVDTTTTHALFATGTTPAFRALAESDFPVNETVTSSATPTFSTAFASSRMTLSANVTTFTLAAGTDGQQKCLDFVQATGPFTVAAPANVHGFFTVGTTTAKDNVQCFTYFSAATAWLAQSTGVINQ